jgi:hypothetical protein
MPATRLTMTMPHLNTSEVLRRYSDRVKNMTLHHYRLSNAAIIFFGLTGSSPCGWHARRVP